MLKIFFCRIYVLNRMILVIDTHLRIELVTWHVVD